MHMADALVSPAVGGVMWGVAAGALAFSGARLRRDADDRRTPLMGVFGAFLFAAQMINFSIPATGSSGHLGGGLLLAILLGPHAALLTTASVLVIQALFFADGGLLALGCNIVNLGVIPAAIAWPLYRRMAGPDPGRSRLTAAAVSTAIVGLQLGSLGVVAETVASGISSLPAIPFLSVMQPIHLAIGIVEGCVTAAIITFVTATRPEIIFSTDAAPPRRTCSHATIAFLVLVLALLTGGIFSRFTSSAPDGLEWSIQRVSGREELPAPIGGVHGFLAHLGEKTALYPAYAPHKPAAATKTESAPPAATANALPGVVGGVVTLGFTLLVTLALRRRSEAPAVNGTADASGKTSG